MTLIYYDIKLHNIKEPAYAIFSEAFFSTNDENQFTDFIFDIIGQYFTPRLPQSFGPPGCCHRPLTSGLWNRISRRFHTTP